ncbi:MAG: HAD-IA family hydrolase [Alphaproteobacteria bacterium]|nr:HAD-IA family hydrolase [Alphaproteobacteria bacterium]
MIRAVIWDFGGVFTTSPFVAFRRFEMENGYPQDIIRTVNSKNHHENAWAKFERNEVDLDEFDQLFRQETTAEGCEVSGKAVIELLAGDFRPEMIEALRRCTEKYITACITNNVNVGAGPAMFMSEDREKQAAEVMSMFELIIESSKVNLRKPDPRIYQLACEKIGVNPEETVYLDDLGVNLKPARELGMKTIKVVDPAVAISELEGFTGLTLG